ncbi:MAG: CRISPR-associated endonuclease Cas2 [Ignavibacteria bacterium]|nr:CRISPR-associated endonuclease Cas2 [Ignavibacteria bacterium]
MYFIAVYDVGQGRVQKVMKFLRTYLNHVQNSVFEGELTPAQYAEVKHGIAKIINKEHDSVIFYNVGSTKWMEREILGQEKRSVSNFL